MSQLSLLDYMLLLLETKDSPRHVGGLQVFELPPDAPEDFVRSLVAEMLASEPVEPFNQKLKVPLAGRPRWVVDPDMDLADHILHEALPAPGREQDLLDRVAQLHGRLLDRNAPLWEVYVIEGLEGGRFGVYAKIHHAYMDGISMSRRSMASLSKTPDEDVAPMWANAEHSREHEAVRKGIVETLFGSAKTFGRLAMVGPQLSQLALRHGWRLLGGGGDLPVPFTAPRTAFNQPLTAARAFGVCSVPLERTRSLAKEQGVTVNDVILALCDTALRRYLDERDEHPDKPLVAQMPISVRSDEGGSGNQVTIALLELASDESDPLARLQEIHEHAGSVKHEYAEMGVEAAEAYTILVQTLMHIGDLAHLSERFPPLGNVLVSNVIGGTEPRYIRGARLTASYPISTIPPGMSMNVTIYSYAGNLHFGVLTGRRAIPDPARIAEGITAAFDELESAAAVSA
ncbi:WS/DGAT/MGAT family O-acyltransferase [Lentisalinibacter orientalis]|uniref:WS/DGAT/MGAT family O-acyltransferase n=1 Tax=Lentisalinibacter orientalis TaxID=2992241 RepID=UPI0038631CA6